MVINSFTTKQKSHFGLGKNYYKITKAQVKPITSHHKGHHKKVEKRVA